MVVGRYHFGKPEPSLSSLLSWSFPLHVFSEKVVVSTTFTLESPRTLSGTVHYLILLLRFTGNPRWMQFLGESVCGLVWLSAMERWEILVADDSWPYERAFQLPAS
jgi:hypothetical protein